MWILNCQLDFKISSNLDYGFGELEDIDYVDLGLGLPATCANEHRLHSKIKII